MNQNDYLSVWRGPESFRLSNDSIVLTYDSRPVVADRIVTIEGSLNGERIFSGFLSIYPPYEITGVKVIDSGTTKQVTAILEFISKKIHSKMRYDTSANKVFFKEDELSRLGSVLEIIPCSHRIVDERKMPMDGAV
jgi:hypothetical protein